MATGISVLRFLAVTQPNDKEWIDRLLNPLGESFLSFGSGQAAMQNGIPLSYLLLAFTDINNEKTRGLIAQKKEWHNLMGKYIIRNALGTLPEYEDITKHEIYVSDADGRCCCDI